MAKRKSNIYSIKILIYLLLSLTIIGSLQGQSDLSVRKLLIKGRNSGIDARGGVPMWWDGFIYGQYSGDVQDCIYFNYTGTGNNVLNLEKDGSSVFTVDESGNVFAAGGIDSAGVYSVLNYGAIGDGVTDDTVAIQAAIDAAKSSSNPGVVFVPTGDYLVSAKLTVNQRVSIVGSGYGSQIFQSADDHLIEFSGASGNSHMSRLMMGSAATSVGTATLFMNAQGGCTFTDLYVMGSYYGVRLNGSHNNLFTRLKTNTNQSGFFGTNNPNTEAWVYSGGVTSNANVFLMPDLGGGNYGFYWTLGEPLTIIGMTNQGGTTPGCYFYGVTGLSIVNAHFESSFVKLHLAGCIGFTLQNINAGAEGIQLDGCSGGSLVDCKSSGSIVIRGDCKSIEVSGAFADTVDNNSASTRLRRVSGPSSSLISQAGRDFTASNIVDGGMEIWTTANIPDPFIKWIDLDTVTKETTIVHGGAASAKVVQGGTSGAGLKTTVDYDRYGRGYRTNYRSSGYQWTASGSGTDENYLEISGGGDPGVPGHPIVLLINNVYVTEATVGSLAAGEWDYGDNDSLGYDTVYVRLSDGTDPDGKALSYVEAIFTYQYITLSGWVYRESGNSNCRLGIRWSDGSYSHAAIPVPLEEWTRISQTFRLELDKSSMEAIFGNCYLGQGDPGDTCYWDDLEITEGDIMSPYYSESKGIEGDFRASGRFVANSAGINTTTPDTLLEIAEESADTVVTISTYHDTEATTPTLTMRKADNTEASPAAIDQNAVLGTINFDGYDDDGWDNGARIYAQADANWGSAERGSDLFFQTRDGNGALSDRITIGADGRVDIGGNLTLNTNAGLTASTTQTQGQEALTAQVNEISTVANDDDTVTLPAAIAGLTIEIINNGANTLQIFPASGDNLGTGVDTATELEANETVKYVAYDATNWSKEATTEIIHAEAHDQDNTDAFVINDAGGDFHAYHTNGFTSGDLAGWTFDTGGGGTSFPVASIADSPGASGIKAQITTTGSHGLAAFDIVSLTNMSAGTNAGIHVVLAPIAATTFEIMSGNSTNATGTMDQAATLDVNTGSAGSYYISWWSSGTSATNNETFDFVIYKTAAVVTGTKVRRKFGTANDFGSYSGGGIVDVADGDKISFALSNEDSAGNIIIRNLTIVLLRL